MTDKAKFRGHSDQPTISKIGEVAFARGERINVEIFALTYGSIVRQLLEDHEDVDKVNEQLEMMGYNIGVRLVDDFLAKSRITSCYSFHDSAEVIARAAFRMYLGINAYVGNWSENRRSFGIVFEDNPLTLFTELPESSKGLWYANTLTGVIRGALEMVQMIVECKYVRCVLRGDDTNEIRVSLKEILVEQPPPDEE